MINIQKIHYQTCFTLFPIIAAVFLFPRVVHAEIRKNWWDVQAVHTMKYSRDTAREFLEYPDRAEKTITTQINAIAEVGATHVAIGTPYDAEFSPILRRWVQEIRKHNMKVWFRGNWSAWEGWFGYPRQMTPEEHIKKTRQFILDNSDLFEDGDIFTACPECENGGPGDPRMNGNPEGFRRHLIDEYAATRSVFYSIGKDVRSNLFSMNGDVARLIMDRSTTAQLGGVITVDHYVRTPQQTIRDVQKYAEQSGGEVVLGEFGIPIPDVHGKMTQQQQAEWLREFFTLAQQEPSILGMNYWTSFGGSTEIWDEEDASPRLAVAVLKEFYSPPTVRGKVTNVIGEPVSATIQSDFHQVETTNGYFEIPYRAGSMQVTAPNYISQTIQNPTSELSVSLVPVQPPTIWRRLIQLILSFLGR